MFPSTLSSWVIPIVRALEAAGCDSAGLLDRAGIPADRLHEPDARFSASQVGRLWELAVEATGEPCFGLTVSEFWHPSSLHALGYAWLASRSLKEGLERVVRYGRVVNSAFKARLDEGEKSFRFTLLHPDPGTNYRPEALDCGFAVLLAMCKASAGPEFAPLGISMCRPPPSCPGKFEAFFRCPLAFSAEFNAVEFRKEDLLAVLPTANSELARASDKIIRDYLARLDAADISRQIRTRLLNTLPAGEIDEASVAKALHMSVRTLQRKLREEGLTFKGLVDDMRRELAIEYIRDARLSLGEVAYLLGFSEPSNFTRAFRRWTGMSPNAYRAGGQDEAFG